ncbi:hypothetical protein [Burkholderia cenocepacia]|uniref:hypothetical protein n=1 Tax=Burkholderia cenocepacia TaxID=95486 RepID=UPI001F5B4749|nr:hypothetical protein [Burkholderia cenocepacia]
MEHATEFRVMQRVHEIRLGELDRGAPGKIFWQRVAREAIIRLERESVFGLFGERWTVKVLQIDTEITIG